MTQFQSPEDQWKYAKFLVFPDLPEVLRDVRYGGKFEEKHNGMKGFLTHRIDAGATSSTSEADFGTWEKGIRANKQWIAKDLHRLIEAIEDMAKDEGLESNTSFKRFIRSWRQTAAQALMLFGIRSLWRQLYCDKRRGDLDTVKKHRFSFITSFNDIYASANGAIEDQYTAWTTAIRLVETEKCKETILGIVGSFDLRTIAWKEDLAKALATEPIASVNGEAARIREAFSNVLTFEYKDDDLFEFLSFPDDATDKSKLGKVTMDFIAEVWRLVQIRKMLPKVYDYLKDENVHPDLSSKFVRSDHGIAEPTAEEEKKSRNRKRPAKGKPDLPLLAPSGCQQQA